MFTLTLQILFSLFSIVVLISSCSDSAQANSIFNVSFSLCDSTLVGKGFNCLDVPNDKEVLSYDESSKKWKPRSVNGLSYKGEWNANDPEPVGPDAGDYYIVSVAKAPYQEGDWIVFNGDDFEKIDNPQMIVSVFGRTGAITADLNDLISIQITTPISGQFLKYNGSKWINSTLTYTETDTAVAAFAKTSLPACNTGDVLKSDGTNFSCVADAAGAQAFSGTTSRAVVTNSSGALVVTTITDTVLGHLSGATSNIQTQLNSKFNSSSFVDWSVGGVQTIDPTRINLATANKVIVTNGGANPVASTVTTAQLGYLSNVTGDIQAQLNSKLGSFNESDPSVSAFAKSSLPTCNTGEILKSNGTSFSCVSDNAGAGSYVGAQNRIVLSDGATGALTTSTITNIEAGYLSGVTSNIQTQLNSKQALGKIVMDQHDAGTVNPFGTDPGETGEFRFYELASNGINYTGFKAPDLLGSIIIYTLPQTAPNAGDILSADGSGVLSWITIPNAPVMSVNSLNGVVTLTTDNISEGTTNKYNTAARVLGTPITAPTLNNTTIATSDTIQVSLGKLQAQISSKEGSLTNPNDTTKYYRADKTFVTLDTSVVPENTNLYFTDARAKSAAVANAIADSVTDIAPSQNAVFDALALKFNSTSFVDWSAYGVTPTIHPSRLSLGLPNASKAIMTNASGDIVTSAVTSVELGHLSGVASAIQTQLNSKQGTINNTTTQDMSRLRVYGINTTNYVEITASAGLGPNINFKLPNSSGANGYILQTDGAGNTSWVANVVGGVISVNGNSGIVTLSTSNISEESNKYYTDAKVINAPLTGLSTASSLNIAATDTTLIAFGKLQGQLNNLLTNSLSGLSTATNSAITAGDNILEAFGKLQAQITGLASSKLNMTGGTLSGGTINGVPLPTNPNDISNKEYVDSFGQWIISGSDIVHSGKVGIGTASAPVTTLDVNGAIKLNLNSSAPYACNATYDGTFALTGNHTICVCKNGVGWVSTLNGTTACTWLSANLTLAATSGSASAMNVTGALQGTLAYGSNVTFTITNTGGATSATISFALSNTTNFAFNGGTCSSGVTTLAPSGTCTIIVRPKDIQNETFSGNLNITANNNPTIAMSGTASGFVADPCAGTPAAGTVCAGGAIFAGTLSPGAISGSGTNKYMTTPGGCGEIPAGQRVSNGGSAFDYPSADFTPTCSGTDWLIKVWKGNDGNWYDIPSLPNYSSTMGAGYGASNTDQYYGSYNTAQISALTTYAEGGHYAAARYCDKLNYGGYTDWYLPNRYELNLLFTNRASIQGFNLADWYWSSTYGGYSDAWGQYFGDGYQSPNVTDMSYLIRCVRRY